MARTLPCGLLALVVAVAACTVDARDRSNGEPGTPRADAASVGDDASTPPVGIDAALPSADAFDEGDCPRVRITTAGSDLRIREEPNTSSEILGGLPNGSVVTSLGSVQGESVSGNTEWFEIDHQGITGFVSGAFAECTTDPPSSVTPTAPGSTAPSVG